MTTQFIVKLACKVTKQVICEDCTLEQAEEEPFDHAVDEVEIEQIDWEVIDVQEFEG
jgi:hypothetical protein